MSAYSKGRLQRIADALKSPSTKLYILFLQYTSKMFLEFLTDNQSAEPRIQGLLSSMCKLLRTVLVKFVKPCAIANKMPYEVEFQLHYNVKCDSDILIGKYIITFCPYWMTIFTALVIFYSVIISLLQLYFPINICCGWTWLVISVLYVFFDNLPISRKRVKSAIAHILPMRFITHLSTKLWHVEMW